MIVADANLFLRMITGPESGTDPALLQTSTAFFRAAEANSLTFTTSEAIVAEVVWVLSGRYGFERQAISTRLRGLLNLTGCRMPTRDVCIAALSVWSTHGQLSFVDALAATMAEQSGYGLATLDRALARYTSADVWAAPVGEM